MTKTDSVANLAAALAVAQGQIQGAIKDKANPFFKSSYADLASVWDACRVPLSANKLSVVQLPAYANKLATVTTLLLHASGEWVSGELSAPVREETPQAIGSAITYLRRYSLSAIVGVAPEEDDGEAAMGRSAAPARKPKPVGEREVRRAENDAAGREPPHDPRTGEVHEPPAQQRGGPAGDVPPIGSGAGGDHLPDPVKIAEALERECAAGFPTKEAADGWKAAARPTFGQLPKDLQKRVRGAFDNAPIAGVKP